MSNEYKNMYRESLICPFIVTNMSGKVLFKNIAAEKILSFVRKGANIMRYIGYESPSRILTECSESEILTLKLSSYNDNPGNYEAISVPFTLDDGLTKVYCHLFKSPLVMLTNESGPIINKLFDRVVSAFEKTLNEIMSSTDEQDCKENIRFVRNNCVRIFHMDKILSSYYIQHSPSAIPVRGVYEVRAMLRELRDYISESSTYLGYRISYDVDDLPFLIYAEPQHFYAMFIFVYSTIYRYSIDGKINITYKTVDGQQSAKFILSTTSESNREYNRFDYNFTEMDLGIAETFAELCGCEISKRTINDMLELEISLTQSEKIKGLLRSNPDMMYLCD